MDKDYAMIAKMKDTHSVHKTARGDFELKCGEEIFTIVKVGEILNWRDPLILFESKLREHVEQKHQTSQVVADVSGSVYTEEDIEASLRNKISMLVTAAKPLSDCTAGWGKLGYPSPPIYICLDREKAIADPNDFSTNWWPHEGPCLGCELYRVIKDMEV